jgi:hypothetical protein
LEEHFPDIDKKEIRQKESKGVAESLMEVGRKSAGRKTCGWVLRKELWKSKRCGNGSCEECKVQCCASKEVEI